MKKLAIGCLAVIGGVVVLSIVMAIISGILTEPTLDQTPVETEPGESEGLSAPVEVEAGSGSK